MARIIQPQSVYNRSVEMKVSRPKSMYDYNPFEKLISPEGAVAAVDIVGKVGGTIADAVDHHTRTRAAEARVDELVKQNKARTEAKTLAEQMNVLEQEGRLTPEKAREMQSKISNFQKKEDMLRAGAMAEQSYSAALASLRGANTYQGQQLALRRMGAAYDRPGSGSLWDRWSGGAEDTLTKQFQRVAPPLYADPTSKLAARGGAGQKGPNRRVGEGHAERQAMIDNSAGIQAIAQAGKIRSSMLESGSPLSSPENLPKVLDAADKLNGYFGRDAALSLARASGGALELGEVLDVGDPNNPTKKPIYRLRVPLTLKQNNVLAKMEGNVLEATLRQFHRVNSEKARRLLRLSLHPNLGSAFETFQIGAGAHRDLSNAERLGAYGDDFEQHRSNWAPLRNWADLSPEQILGITGQAARWLPAHSDFLYESTVDERQPLPDHLPDTWSGDSPPPDSEPTELDKEKAAASAGGMNLPPSAVSTESRFRPPVFYGVKDGKMFTTTEDPRKKKKEASSFYDIVKRHTPPELRYKPPVNPDDELVQYDVGDGKMMEMTRRQAREMDAYLAKPTTAKEDKETDEMIRKNLGIDPNTGDPITSADDTEPKEPKRKYRYQGPGISNAKRKIFGRYGKYTPQAVGSTLSRPPAQDVMKRRQKAMAVAKEYGVDPLLFDALIKKESEYHPFAVSSANALGLTQVTPVAWDQIGGSPEDFSRLFDEDISLRAGAQYLKWVEKTLTDMKIIKPNDPKRIQKILAGYNAGIGSLKNEGIAAVLSPKRKARGTVGQTYKYVRDIMRNMARNRKNSVAERL